jgi:trans-feruloyl-CoA hydratase/vanillin synthase
MDYSTLKVEADAGIVTLTLNRPEKKNAMNPTLHVEMQHALRALAADRSVRVLVLTGAGDSFCAGMDLKEYFYEVKDDPHAMEENRQISQEWRDRQLRLFPTPTIAMVNGNCFGGGLSIVAGCDLALAAEDAPFGLSEINFGQLAAGPVSKYMDELLSDRDALWYIYTGEKFSGTRAAEIGLVNRAVSADDLVEETYALARTIAEKNPMAMRLAKQLYRHTKSMDHDAALNYANAKVRELTALDNGSWIEEGIGQFLDGKFRPGHQAYSPEPRS